MMNEQDTMEKWLCRLEGNICQYPLLSKVYIRVVVSHLGLTRPGSIFGFFALLLVVLLLILVALIHII